MQLAYGGYLFPTNQCEVTGRLGALRRSDAGRPCRAVLYLDVNGTLLGSGQAQMTALENQLRNALSQPYGDLVLRQDSGIPSGLLLVNRQSLSGVVVTSGPDFYEAQGAEYVTKRQFRFTAEATYLVPGAAAALISWTQTISSVGTGGPNTSWRIPLNADPIRQVVTPRTTIRYTQSGAAVGHLAYPFIPPPVFGTAYLQNPEVAVSRITPTPLGRNWVDWPVTWNYVFESDRPLVGVTPLPVF